MKLQVAKRKLQDAIDHLYGDPEAHNIAKYYFDDTIGLSHDDYILSVSELRRWARDLGRLVSGQPLQYVTGVAHFYGHALLVSDQTLIPRPETEELTHRAIQVAKQQDRPIRVLDIGTGSGCIAITVKAALGGSAMVTAIDVSPAAVINAIDNSQLLDAPVLIHQLDIMDDSAIEALSTYDLILSNPPYIPHAESHLMPPHVKDHEPSIALFVSDDDPLLYYRRILSCSSLVRPGTIYLLEVNEHNAADVVALARGILPGAAIELHTDLQGKSRVLEVTT